MNAGKRLLYSLKQAADAVGRGKPAILKAIKSGRLSAKKDDLGQWRIDPAELHRVYPLHSGTISGTPSGERQETPRETSGVGSEIEMMRERIVEKDALITDLRSERDRLLAIVETQAQQVALLTDQRPPAARRAWWKRLFGA